MLRPKFGYVGQRLRGEPASEQLHFYACRTCGQAVDKRDLAAVFHHESREHEPLTVEEANRVLRVTSMMASTLGNAPTSDAL